LNRFPIPSELKHTNPSTTGHFIMKRVILNSFILLTAAGFASASFGNEDSVTQTARSATASFGERNSPRNITPSAGRAAAIAKPSSGKPRLPIGTGPLDPGWVKRDLNGLHPRHLDLGPAEQEGDPALRATGHDPSLAAIANRALGSLESTGALADTGVAVFNRDERN
jgi:hypothetical protein